MGNIKKGKTVSIFSIVYAIINFLPTLNGELLGLEGTNTFGIAISLSLLAVGVISLIKLNREETIKGYVIAMLVFWFLLLVVSVFFLVIPVLGVVIFLVGVGVSITPIITGFQYLSSLKETTPTSSFGKDTDIDGVVENLERITNLLNEGAITQEEYNRLRKKILEE